jgi:hypothetical protein
MKLHLIYVPGLGDTRIAGQRFAVWMWRLWGVHAEVCQMHWMDKGPWQPKLDRLLQRIDELTAAGETVGLVGTSAGVSAVLHAFALRKSQIVGCVLIAGKVQHPEHIRERYRRENPAFVTAVEGCQQVLGQLEAADRKRILNRYAWSDHIVPAQDSYIDGVHNRRVPTIGHVFTIATQVTVGAPGFIRFLRQLSRH